MDIFRQHKFNEAMFAKKRTLAIRVGRYQSSDIKEANFEYGYIKGDTYKPGGTCAGSAKIVFTSIITTFNKLDKIYPEIGLLVDGTYEWVKMGEYFINDIEIDRNRNTTTLDLMDGMFKLNREYVTDLTYPADIKNVIKEICLKTGIKLADEIMGIASMNYQIDKVPENKKMTFRDVLSLSTQMLGMSCFFNREGKLEIKGLTDSGITITADNYFLHGLTRSEVEYQIAGITCKKDKETLTVGLRTGRSLEIENVLMYQSALDNLYYNIKDIRYYPFSLNYQGYLLLDVGQWVTIKTNTGETFKSPILSQSFNFKGGLRSRISADSKAGNDAQYSYAGTITKKILQFDNFEAQLQNKIEEADRGFDAKVDQIKQDFSDQIKLVEAKTEENKRSLSEEINRRFQDFNPAGFEEVKATAEEALRNAGASTLLAQEAKRIGLDSVAKLEEFKRQATSAQTALSGDLDVLKRTVASEVNQASEYRRTTTEALSRMTGQMDGFATKSEVRQDVTGLTETFARLKTDTNNLISGAKNEITLAKTEFKKTADGLSAKMAAVESYVGQDGQRQEALRKYTRDESARQATAVRELVTRDYVGKASHQEDVRAIERKFEAITNPKNGSIATQIANYKQSVDGRFADITSSISGKANQVDFQRVQETSRLYERILGNTDNGIADNVARMAMTSQLFQVEVSKYASQGGPNLIKNSGNPQDNKHWGYWEFGQNPAVRVGTHDFFFKNKRNLFYLNNKTRDTVPTSTIRFPLKRNTVYSVALTAFNTWNMKGATIYFLGRKSGEKQSFTRIETLANNTKFSSNEAVRKNYTFNSGECDEGFIRIDNNGTNDNQEAMLLFGDVDVYEGTVTRPWQPSPEDNNEAVRTVQSQLAGSYAIQNLNSAGDLINGINLAADGTTRFVSKLTHISGDTLIDNAVIKSAMIAKLKTANFEAGSVTTNILGAEAVTAEKVKFDTAFIQRLVSQQAFINELFAKQATITKIQSIDFTGNHIKGGRISSLNGKTTFDLQSGWIDMNTEAVGIRNRFDNKPLQYLIFGQGAINGVPGAYTQLMSNRNGVTGIEHTSAGIQIWNGRQGDNIQTAITFYGKTMDFMPNSLGGGITVNTENRTISNLDNIYFRGTSLVTILDLINKNFEGIATHFEYNRLGAPGRYKVSV